jgi:hypothetical protein
MPPVACDVVLAAYKRNEPSYTIWHGLAPVESTCIPECIQYSVSFGECGYRLDMPGANRRKSRPEEAHQRVSFLAIGLQLPINSPGLGIGLPEDPGIV